MDINYIWFQLLYTIKNFPEKTKSGLKDETIRHCKLAGKDHVDLDTLGGTLMLSMTHLLTAGDALLYVLPFLPYPTSDY